MSQTATDVEE